MMNEKKLTNRILLLSQDDLETMPYHRIFAIIEYLRDRVERLDVLYYDRSYDRDVSTLFGKFKEGLFDFIQKPELKVKTDQNVTYYGVRRLPLDGVISTWFQDPWIYSVFRKNNKMKYDLCISEAPGPARIARWLKKNGFCRYYIYDDTDYFPGFTKSFREKVIFQQEIDGTQNADMVITVGEKLLQLRTHHGAKDVRLIPNGVDLKSYSQIQKDKNHPPRLIYTGSLEEWAGINLVLESLPTIRESIPDLEFWIIGDGPMMKSLVSQAYKMNQQDYVRFLGKKPPFELHSYYAVTDIGIITPVPSRLWEYACPLKLFQYMAAGLPVICTDIGELSLLVQRYNAGIPVDYNKFSFSQKTTELLHNPGLQEEYGNNGREAVKKYDWSILMETYGKTIEEVLNADRN